MDTRKHIFELLHHNDCVILPGVGGFVIHEKEGTYDRISRQFFPPSKTVSFNALLSADDGLLISRIADVHRISYAEAREKVKDFSKLLVKQAHSAEGARLEGIGQLHYSKEGKLQFEPARGVNFLETSFGLAPVYAKSIVITDDEPARARSMKPRVDRIPETPRTKAPTSVKWTVSLALPVMLFLLWGILFPSSFQHYYTSYSGILTDVFQKEKIINEKPVVVDTKDNMKATTQEVIPSVVETQNLNSAVPDNVAQEEEKNGDSEEQPLVEEKTEIIAVAPSMIYHVIAGVFSMEENAERYQKALIGLGYHSQLVGTNKRGMHRVSYESFESWGKAEVFLESIQETENPSAWILKY